MSDRAATERVGAALVAGGGIGGMEAALALAEAGIKVYLVDRQPAIGGVMSQLDKTFPTNDCAMCTMAPRLVAIGRHPDIEVLPLSEVERIDGAPGNLRVVVGKRSRFINADRCTGCGSCVAHCPTWNRVQPVEPAEVELDAPFREAVVEIVQRHKAREGPLMPILQDVNRTLNYLPESVLRYVAREIGQPLSHVVRIATFYSGFSTVPRGKHVVTVCTGTTCYVRGSERLLEKLGEALGIGLDETTPDMGFTLRSARCIGCCGLAPAVMVGGEVYGRLNSRRVVEIVREYRGRLSLEGEPG